MTKLVMQGQLIDEFESEIYCLVSYYLKVRVIIAQNNSCDKIFGTSNTFYDNAGII